MSPPACAAPAPIWPPPPPNCGGRALVRALQLRDGALDRAARHELNDRERDRHDAENRRDHQQEPAEDIGEHAASAGLRGAKRQAPIRVQWSWPSLRPTTRFLARRCSSTRLLLGTRKRVPMRDPGRVAIPHRHPIMAGAQDAVERSAGRVEFIPRFRRCDSLHERVHSRIGDAGEIARGVLLRGLRRKDVREGRRRA